MAKGSKYKIEDILKVHGGMLSRIAAAYERDGDTQKDLLQDIALAIWKALPGFQEKSSLKTFVARIAQNRAITHVSSEVRRPKNNTLDVEMPSQMASPEDEVGQKLKVHRLQSSVRALPLPLRQVATLALEGFEAREIAEALGISANNASVRLNRAKEALMKDVKK